MVQQAQRPWCCAQRARRRSPNTARHDRPPATTTCHDDGHANRRAPQAPPHSHCRPRESPGIAHQAHDVDRQLSARAPRPINHLESKCNDNRRAPRAPLTPLSRLSTSHLADQQNLIKIDIFRYLILQIEIFQNYQKMRPHLGKPFHILCNNNFIIRSARKITTDLRIRIDPDAADPF